MHEPEKIKNLLLDLGGVFYDLDFQKAVNAFEAIGIRNFNEVYAHAHQTPLFDLFERGEITTETFRNEIRRMAARDIPSALIDEAWNALLIGFPLHRMELIEKLSQKYNLYLLSNTNELHLSAVVRQLESSFGLKRFEKPFKKLYYSSRMGRKKPDAGCFEFVFSDAGISKSDTLFIDDTVRHVEGARQCGVNAIHLDLLKEDIHRLIARLRLI